VSELLTELIEECMQLMGIMSEEELRALVESLPPYYQYHSDYNSPPHGKEAKLERLALSYMEALLQERYFTIRDVITTDERQSEVFKIYPELRSRFDKDGLLELDDRFRLSDNAIYYKDHVLHYHQFLRRGFASNPNFDFLRKFIAYYYASREKRTFRIAIDHRRIVDKKTFRERGEMDAWLIARFDRSKLDDRNAVGSAVVENKLPQRYRFMFSNIDRTEFYWKYDGGIKTFEAEELSSPEQLMDSYFLNRYVHTERDITRGIFRHFDGAVKVYLKNEYGRRLAAQMPVIDKSYKKVKVFRIDEIPSVSDGGIDVDAWVEMVGLFYKGNINVIEYFDQGLYEWILDDLGIDAA
jgi:hypothetical protein